MNHKHWIALLIVAMGLGGYYMRTPRGIRNNNPGNIRRTSDQWTGLATKQTDPEYFQFIDAKWGLRALMKLLLNYHRLYGIETVEEIINRWAPANENDTQSYMSHVANMLAVDPFVPLENYEGRLIDLAKAITTHENGQNPYDLELYVEALEAI